MNVDVVQRRLWRVKKHMESRMLGNLHVRFGVGVEVEFLGLHHLVKEAGRGD